MMTKYICKALIKFGQKEHMEMLFRHGQIYMNPLSYFHKVEKNEDGRRDVLEGTDYLYSKTNINITLPNGLSFGGDVEQTRIRWDKSLEYSIFSMYSWVFEEGNQYSLKEMENITAIDNDCLKFGDYAVIIGEPQVFFERMISACEKRKIKYCYGGVQYVDKDKHEGEYGLLRKPNEYSYQREVRFIVENTTAKPIILNIESIEDISILEKKELINERMRECYRQLSSQQNNS